MFRYLFLIILFFTAVNIYATTYPYGLQTEHQTTEFNKVTKQLRCLVCDNQSIYESDSPFAESIRTEAAKMIIAGKTPQQVITFFKNRYGQYIDYEPNISIETILLWIIPYAVLLLIILFFVFRYFFQRK